MNSRATRQGRCFGAAPVACPGRSSLAVLDRPPNRTDQVDRTFGDVLRRLRRDRALTQEALAEAAALSSEAIRALEGNRRRYPRPTTVDMLIAALCCTSAEAELLRAVASRNPEELRQLPPGLTDFTGRRDDLKTLAHFLTAGASSPAVPVATITGMGGIGKTALALQAANEVKDHFPDGQVLLDLRGFSRSGPMDPVEVLALLLQQLGTPSAEVPSDLDRAAARYRSAIAGRRILLVFDNAADSAQVAPLLPGTAGCGVLITSRRMMADLPGAAQTLLEGLPEQEAIQLLAEVAGPSAVADPDTAVRIVQYCARLPLAIRLAGARLIGRSSPGALAARLADEAKLLDTLDDHGRGVRTSLAISVDDLARSASPIDVSAGQLLPRLALLDGHDISPRIAGRIAGVSAVEADRLLDRLTDVNLLETPEPSRYRLHDLVAAYFDERASDADRTAVRVGALAAYRAMLWRMMELARRPAGLRERWADPEWTADARDVTERDTLLDLLDGERANLLATVRNGVAGTSAERELSVQVAAAMKYYGVARKRWAEWRDVSALAAPLAVDDPVARAMLLADHGLALAELGGYSPAADSLLEAVDVLGTVDDPRYRLTTMLNLSHVLERAGRAEEGLEYAGRNLGAALALGDREAEALTWLVRGMIYGAQSDSRREECFTAAVSAMTAGGPVRGLATVHQQIGLSHRESGDYAAAAKALEKSLQIYQADQAHPYLPDVQEDLGWVQFLSGDAEASVVTLQAALNGAQKQDQWDREASVQLRLGQVLAELGRLGEAKEHLTAAAEIYGRRGMAAADEARAALAALAEADPGLSRR